MLTKASLQQSPFLNHPGQNIVTWLWIHSHIPSMPFPKWKETYSFCCVAS
jgi:hypothetical protein